MDSDYANFYYLHGYFLLSYSNIFFNCYSFGAASGLVSRRMSASVIPPYTKSQRSMSMEEYDKPMGVENLVYNGQRKYSIAGEDTINEEGDSEIAA
ncbi:unnamed protein product [Protopolystoma xenopodis]|uniref:Uncharacterized protein n=1 Tax=Protopolystoma xenopodis TaxID=117903 RepID=A0A3S5FH15_9PLAT|nr:unnamed protein product [Protopolystoma xenopodis]